MGRACAHHQPGGSLRRQHLLSASTRARLLRAQHRRGHARRADLGSHAQSFRGAQLSRPDGVFRVGHLHVAPRPSADWRRRRRRNRVDPVRVLPVRLRPHRPHPAADGRGHSAQPARLSSPGRCAVSAARRGAWFRARGASDVVLVLRRLGRPDHRVCHAFLRVVAAPLDDDTLLDRDRHRRGVVARHRGAVLPAVPGDPGRDRLRALARRCAAVVGVRAVVPGVGIARARLAAAAHPRMERGRALSRFPLDRPRTRRRRDRASRAERPRRDAAAFSRP